MPRSLQYIFPAGNISDVCDTQTLNGMGNFVLNGDLADQIYSQVSFLSHGYSRSISVTSGEVATFTIIGIQNGVSVTENLTSIIDTTVYGAQVYDAITSVSANGPCTAAIGTGYLGFFPLINIDLNRSPLNYSLNTQLSDNPITISIYSAYDNIVNNGVLYLHQVENNDDDSLFTIEENITEAYELPIGNIRVYRSILISIEGVAGNIDESIKMNFIQM